MKVSIVTVCYNSKATIRNTIESVLSQSYANIEYIIVDGASPDGTMAIIDEYKDRIATVLSEPDEGIYDAMNKGVQLATGDLVGILNSDDFYESDSTVADIVAEFVSEPKADLIFGNVAFIDRNDLNKVIRYYSSAHFKPWKLRFGWMPPHPGTFITKSAYDLVGPYALDYKIGADFEMFIRLLLIYKLKFKRINKTIVKMRIGGVSTSGLKSNLLISFEINKALKRNKIYSNILLVLSRLPFKLLERCNKLKST